MNATTSLIAFNCVMFLLVHGGIWGSHFTLGLNMYFTQGLFLWQPVTSMFMHANFTHLLMNMAVLYQFGSVLERYLGTKKFSLLYLIGGVATSILSFIYIYYAYEYQNLAINLVGASGAISVLLGALAFIDKSSAKGIFIAVLLMSFAPLLVGVNIAWYAHLIGFGVGYFAFKARLI